MKIITRALISAVIVYLGWSFVMWDLTWFTLAKTLHPFDRAILGTFTIIIHALITVLILVATV